MGTNGAVTQNTAQFYSVSSLHTLGYSPKDATNVFVSKLDTPRLQDTQNYNPAKTIKPSSLQQAACLSGGGVINPTPIYPNLYDSLGLSCGAAEETVDGLIDIFNNSNNCKISKERNQGLVLEFYNRIANNTIRSPEIEYHINNIYCQKPIVSWKDYQNLAVWRQKHGFYSILRARLGFETVKLFFINLNNIKTVHDQYAIIENILFHLKCCFNVVIVPSDIMMVDGWASIHGNNIGCFINGIGLYPNKIIQLANAQYNRAWFERFYKIDVPKLNKEHKCLSLKYQDYVSVSDHLNLDRKLANFFPINYESVSNFRSALIREIRHKNLSKYIPIPANDDTKINFRDSSFQSPNISSAPLASQTTSKVYDFQDSWIFDLLNSSHDQDLLTQQEKLSIEELECLIQSDDFQHVMKIPRDSEAIDAQIPRETMWLQIDSHEFPDLNYNELLELIEQAGKNKDRWLDVSHWYEKSTGRVFFNGNPYSIKELHFKAKDDFDFMAALAFYWYREVPWRREKAIGILNKLEEHGNVYASHYLGTIRIFYDPYSQAKTANHYIKAVSKIRNCHPQGHHIESIIYGNLGITLWWWQDLFKNNEKTRLFNAYKLLCKGAALGNVYILGRLAEFLCKAIDTHKSRLIARIIIDKLVQWKTFLADYYSASIEYMHNFESIRCEDEKYKEIVEKLERSIRDEKWDSFPISKQKIKLSLAFIFLRHDQSKTSHALNMLYEADKNKAEEFSKCETRQKELDYIRDFFYIENKYLNFEKLKETLSGMAEEINRLKMELAKEKKNNDELKNQVAYFRCRADNSMPQGNSPESHHVDNSTNKNHDNYAPMEDSISLQQKSTINLELPTKVPSKWIWKNWKQHNSGASPEVLLKESEFWKPYYDAGVLYQDVLSHLDATLYKALDNHCYNKSKAKPENEKIRLRDILKPKKNRIDLEVERYKKAKESKKALRQATKAKCLKIAMEGHQEDLKEENRLRASVWRRENVE